MKLTSRFNTSSTLAPIIGDRGLRPRCSTLLCGIASTLLIAATGCVQSTRTDPEDGAESTAAALSTPEYRASAYVEDALAGFRRGAITIGGVRVRAPLPNAYGVDADSTGRTIGGNFHYGDWVAREGAESVTTLVGLQAALTKFEDAVNAAIRDNTPFPLRTIYIPDGVDIDTGSATLRIAPGLTLASGRGREIRGVRSDGAILRSTSEIFQPAFVILPHQEFATARPLPPVRVTGLRFIGPNSSAAAPDCSSDGRSAFRAKEAPEGGDRNDPANMAQRIVEFDNNESAAWPAYAIQLGGISQGFVHHNFIHHSQREAQGVWCAVTGGGLHAKGYGVETNNGLTYIEANIFESNRHSIASRGDKFTDYVAMYNIVLQAGPSHTFDVHGGEDRGDHTTIAGRRIVIAYNDFRNLDQDAINVRGNPVDGAWITRNRLAQGSGAIEQTKASGPAHFTPSDNVFNYSPQSTGPGPGPGPHGTGGPVIHEN